MSTRTMYSMENIKWSTLIGLAVVHGIAFLAPFFSSWRAVWIAVALYVLTAWVGVGLCLHRLLTHQSFKTPRWFRYVLIVIALLSLQGGVLFWVGKHRIHHRFSDQDGDPHSPNDGFGWAHVLWLIFRKEDGHDPMLYVRDLVKDRGIVFLDRFAWAPTVILGIVLLFLGYRAGGAEEATAWVVWGIGVRTTFVYHLTWFVNSACHKWGYKNSKTSNDGSRNFWPVALPSAGEGWHDNHHDEPMAASHGMRLWELDLTFWIITLLRCVGLAWDVVLPKRWKKTRFTVWLQARA